MKVERLFYFSGFIDPLDVEYGPELVSVDDDTAFPFGGEFSSHHLHSIPDGDDSVNIRQLGSDYRAFVQTHKCDQVRSLIFKASRRFHHDREALHHPTA